MAKRIKRILPSYTELYKHSITKWNYISKVGLELEGAWIDKNPERFTHDGSVSIGDDDGNGHYDCIGDDCCGNCDDGDCCMSGHCLDWNCDNGYNPDYDRSNRGFNRVGESRSYPMNNIKVIHDYMNENYPDFNNDTCGLHIHISFKNKAYYSLLMDNDFYNWFLTTLADYGEKYPITNKRFWSRLKGENTYCHKKFEAHKQAKTKFKGSDRYAHLNYCYNLHSTIEFRLLPMFKNKNVAMDTINAILNIVEYYISTNISKIKLGTNESKILEVDDIIKVGNSKIIELISMDKNRSTEICV